MLCLKVPSAVFAEVSSKAVGRYTWAAERGREEQETQKVRAGGVWERTQGRYNRGLWASSKVRANLR